ncbi:MAG TPA: hypothetical protein VFF06_21370 [Polyangia bacterium]|nr:hypothetical protein [Polyangia bacterium]
MSRASTVAHAVALAAALSAGACQPRTEIVVGILTDLPVPGSLMSIGLDADRDGVPVDRRGWPMANAPLELPGTYGLYSPSGGSTAITIVLSGFRTSITPVVTRTVNVTLLEGKTLFLRMALVQACINHSCPAGKGCVEGACVDENVDSRTLPAYQPELAQIVACDSGTHYIDVSTGAELPIAGSCPSGQTCQEGLCYLPPP